MRFRNSRTRGNLAELPHSPRTRHGRIGAFEQLGANGCSELLMLSRHAIVGQDDALTARCKEARGASPGDCKSVHERGHDAAHAFVGEVITRHPR
jgi:hypothetical protein